MQKMNSHESSICNGLKKEGYVISSTEKRWNPGKGCVFAGNCKENDVFIKCHKSDRNGPRQCDYDIHLKLQGGNIVPVTIGTVKIIAGTNTYSCYLYQKFGVSLRKYFDKNKAKLRDEMPLLDKIFDKVRSKYNELSDQRIFHSDISPDNILITVEDEEIEIRLTDFELAEETEVVVAKDRNNEKVCIALEVLKTELG
jgi:serine/threonine protein kinase